MKIFIVKKIKKLLFIAISFNVSLYSQTPNDFCFNPIADLPFNLLEAGAISKADFNSDGQMDICAQNSGTSTGAPNGIGVLLSNGSGSYTTFSTITLNLTQKVKDTKTGDFNNDGKADIIAISDNTNLVYVLLGLGNGGFAPTSTISLANFPMSLVTADFNNDTKADIAILNSLSNSVSILLGVGNGSFTISNTYSVGINPRLMIAGDFDNDNAPDLFIASYYSSYFLKGSINGSFTVIPYTNLPATGAIGVDVNSENKLDLVYTDINGGRIDVLVGNGNFAFSPPLSYTIPLASGGKISSGDFNNDNKIDLVTLTQSYQVAILSGIGGGLFSPALNFSTYSPSLSYIPYDFIINDINQDNKSDVVILANSGNMPGGQFKLLLNCNGVNVEIKENLKNQISINFFPNPVTDFLQIQFNGQYELAFTGLTIYNSLGQIIKKGELIHMNNPEIINLANLENGIYTIILTNGQNENIKEKMVVYK